MSSDTGARRSQARRDDRAESTVVGTILLVGVVILSISMVGTALVGSLLASADDPHANLDGTLTDSGLEIVHRGGDTLPESELTVRIANESTVSVTDFESGTIVAGNADGQFERSEQWRNATAIPSATRLDVWVTHEPTATLIYEDTLYAET